MAKSPTNLPPKSEAPAAHGSAEPEDASNGGVAAAGAPSLPAGESQAPAEPTSAADLVAQDRDGFPGEANLPGSTEATEAAGGNPGVGTPGSPATPTTAAAMVAGDKETHPPDGGSAPVGRPRLEDTPERRREREKKARQKAKREGREYKPEEPPLAPVVPMLPPSNPPPPMPPPVDYGAMGAVLVDLVTQTAANILGPEWLPRSIDDGKGNKVEERTVLIGATAAYLKSRQMPDIPPGWVLVAVVAAYATPRFTQPTTRQRIGGVLNWFKGLFKRKPRPGEAQPVRQAA